METPTLRRLASRTWALLGASGRTLFPVALLGILVYLCLRIGLRIVVDNAWIAHFVLALLVMAGVQSAMLRAVLAASRGERGSIGTCLRFSATRLGPALLLAIPVMLALYAYTWTYFFVFLLVTLCGFCLLGPPLLFESVSFGQAFRRLTHWPILIAMVAVLTASSLALIGLYYSLLLATGGIGALGMVGSLIQFFVLLPLAVAAFLSLWACASIAWYEATGPGKLDPDLSRTPG